MTDIEVDEDTEQTPDEFLDWLCWSMAMTGERFYPPKETARECLDALDIEADGYGHGVEVGQHGRAWSDAYEFFKDMEYRGFDPKARAQREIQRSREEGLDLPDIDWEWWEDDE